MSWRYRWTYWECRLCSGFSGILQTLFMENTNYTKAGSQDKFDARLIIIYTKKYFFFYSLNLPSSTNQRRHEILSLHQTLYHADPNNSGDVPAVAIPRKTKSQQEILCSEYRQRNLWKAWLWQIWKAAHRNLVPTVSGWNTTTGWAGTCYR